MSSRKSPGSRNIDGLFLHMRSQAGFECSAHYEVNWPVQKFFQEELEVHETIKSGRTIKFDENSTSLLGPALPRFTFVSMWLTVKLGALVRGWLMSSDSAGGSLFRFLDISSG